MQGFITDEHLRQADQEFPGILEFFASLAQKPRTFLELLAAFEQWIVGGDACAPPVGRCAATSTATIQRRNTRR